MTVEVLGIDRVIRRLERMKRDLEDKNREFIEKLALEGIQVASARFSNAIYDGTNDATVGDVVWIDDTTAEIIASGRSVLFIEFGSGLIGYGHPEPREYGPGTWSDNIMLGGKGHWQDPNGWYYVHGQKSYGNPPARAMYDAGKTMRERVATIAKEVFGDD